MTTFVQESRPLPLGWRARLRSDRGELPVTLIVFPAVILAFYFAIHAALVFHGRSVVAAAAQDGLRAAQIEHGTEADGVAAANATLALSPGLTNQSVEVIQGDDTVVVKVSAEVETLLVNILTNVSAEASGPRERFYSEAERP
jgi:Flp pilus assembly protein TadG